MTTSTRESQHGFAHLALFGILFVAIVGVLGFVGYNAWQKQSANAGGVATLQKPAADSLKYVTCNFISASPTPKVGVTTMYKVKFKTYDASTKVGVGVVPGPGQDDPIKGQWSGLSSMRPGQTKTLSITYKTPAKSGGQKVDYIHLSPTHIGSGYDFRGDGCSRTFTL